MIVRAPDPRSRLDRRGARKLTKRALHTMAPGLAVAAVVLVAPLPLYAQGVGAGTSGARHMDTLTNKPCLEYEGVSRPLASNNKVFTHTMIVSNRCGKRITVKICYHKTEQCVDVEVPARDRKEAALGVFPAVQYFRYDYKEKFELGSRS